ncbi:MAG TPA: GNAT family N-acetyltransferase [Solirubrobacteraceae bacterium]|nr:GNAT family N-acetyltransferase [Solirubrobacteraceae bacterium]
MARSINSLVWATDIDVLAPDHTVERRDGYWVVRSPSNPTFWWGNLLLFDDAPAVGDGERWEALFTDAFACRPEVTHCTLAWDRVDGERGAAEHEFVARGYELEWTSGLVARPERLIEHPGANREASVRALDPDGDEELWEAVIEVQRATALEQERDIDAEYHLTFLRRRQRELREVFRQGRGSWYLALLDGTVAGSLGIVVTDTRARYQTVDTVAEFRRRGIARRLLVEAARHACSRHAIDHFVIAADPDYHAIGIYEGLGFERVELVVGAMRKPADS